MAETAENRISLPLENAREIFANSSNFQSWVGAGSPTIAKNNIHLVALAGDSIARPYLLLSLGNEWESDMIAGGASNFHQDGGTIEAFLEADITEAYYDSPEDAEFEFTNPVGGILGDVLTLGGQGVYLSVHRIAQLQKPTRSSRKEQASAGYYYQAKYLLSWGV